MRTKKVNAKKRIFLIVAALFALCAVSCGGNNSSNPERVEEIREFAFELANYAITGKSTLTSPQEYYYPQELNFIMNRYYWENGQRYFMAEKYVKSKTGVIEGNLFYNPMEDSGDWVENLVILTEEQRIADEINSMEEAYESAEFEGEQLEKEILETLTNDNESKDLVGKNSKLRIMEFENEVLIPQQTEDSYITIEAEGSSVKRSFYDSSFRLYKKELWKIEENSDGTLIEEETLLYEGEDFRPVEKTVRTEKNVTKTVYNEKYLAVSSEVYTLVERKKTKSTDAFTQEVLTQEYKWSYNDEDKVQLEICTLYFFDKDYKKIDYTFEKKHKYTYNDFSKEEIDDDDDAKDIPPDFEYYENDVLKMKTKYTAELGTYTSQIFFENDMAVKTYYKKYKKEKDVYTQGNTVTRIKEYEE